MIFPHVHIKGCHDAAEDCASRDDISLILKPERVMACPLGEVQFSAFIRTPEGEIALTQGLVFESSDASVLTIDISTGLASLIASGSATVSVAWQDRVAFSNVVVVGSDGACCDDMKVAFEVVIDNSLSMGDHLNEIFTKLVAAKILAKTFTDRIRIEKDVVGLSKFNTNIVEVSEIGSTLPTDANLSDIEQTTAATILSTGIKGAIALLDSETADQKVILLFSDGDNRPSVTHEDDEALVESAKMFKESGGIIIVVGIRAFGNGFDLLQKIAGSGFFLNVYGEGMAPLNSAAASLDDMMSYFCSATSAELLYLYENESAESGLPVSAQSPDPLPLRCIHEPL